ncbi:two-pore potassium channel 1-like isoform X1 [Magnolia sinica]|uniref:two-pore potassium channel 1-like isoform X1 n=1 Tax=Magnolia sinica TaxID=86752 RepID=UPI0026582E39|nr:two-pore potassium channel 1-like isoform X1 [Magnolia sinica]XP_058070599.1 two-pore potassium channel 1-like isoform X1 [Magnolia sinica]XP_058070600.1 two-pore potassium channel 1-like isoform X1 [Magnolia sinica]
MASNGTKQSLISGLVDPPHQPKQKINLKKRRLRRCRSAPTVDVSLEKKCGLSPISQSILGKFNLSFTQVGLLLAIYLGIVTLCFFAVKNQIKGKTNSIVDSLYFCIVTMTTVGYGDLVPVSVPAKLLACLFVFIGMALVGLILSKAADYLVEKQEILLVKALNIWHEARMMEIMKEIETNKVKYKLLVTTVVLMVLIVVGTIFLSKIEDLSLVDSFYCVCSTITTLGYGDKSFSTEGGRIFAVFWILTSTICLAQFFLYIAELNAEHRQQALVKWVLTRKMTSGDLEAANLDEDKDVSAAEFVIYKLKEMGKIGQDDIALLMKEFEKLDVDQSGNLSASDLLAQSSSKGS